MEEEEKGNPPNTQLGGRIINMLIFQPEQDRMDKSLKEIDLSSAPGILHRILGIAFLTDGFSSLTKKYKKL